MFEEFKKLIAWLAGGTELGQGPIHRTSKAPSPRLRYGNQGTPSCRSISELRLLDEAVLFSTLLPVAACFYSL